MIDSIADYEVNKHIAFGYSFDDLINGLNSEIEKGYIKEVESDGLTLYNYTNKCTYDAAWNDFTASARGLIVDKIKKKIVAVPFPKFFNYQELGYKTPKLPFETFEKLDGSLIILYYYDGSWQTATRGSFNSPQAQWAKEWFIDNVNEDFLHKDLTYLCEAIYPENRIVVNYDYEGLVLLSSYSRTDGIEIDGFVADSAAKNAGFIRPKQYNYHFEELLSIVKDLSIKEEGFVVRFSNGYRIKIKGDEYCRVHRLISQVTPLGVWNAMMNNDCLRDIKLQLPEEYWVDFDNISDILLSKFGDTIKDIMLSFGQTKHYSDKELGLLLQSDGSNLSLVGQKFIFTVRKLGEDGFMSEVQQKSTLREKVFKIFRPTGNQLDGYEPTSCVNRFNWETNG